MRSDPATTPQTEPRADGSDVQRLVVADLEARRLLGIRRYGVPVGVYNGRDHLVDLYQELLDACVYIRAEIEKRKPNRGDIGDE